MRKLKVLLSLKFAVTVLLLTLTIIACGIDFGGDSQAPVVITVVVPGAPAQVAQLPPPTYTPVPPAPTYTPVPPAPTYTPVPLAPTYTPVPPAPTYTPIPGSIPTYTPPSPPIQNNKSPDLIIGLWTTPIRADRLIEIQKHPSGNGYISLIAVDGLNYSYRGDTFEEFYYVPSATTKLKVRIAKSAHMWETF